MDSKDSGHETSSIHTENSDSSSNASNDAAATANANGDHSRTPSSIEDSNYAATNVTVGLEFTICS
jgi:hypothetical protein